MRQTAKQIIQIHPATDMDEVRELFREYQNFLNVDLCFQGFEDELKGLPGKYALPHGEILIATVAGKTAGIVAVRPLKEGTCEMKRLWVRPDFQGLGIGRLLAEAIIDKAKALGYDCMQLDTLKRLEAALALYKKLGFVEISAYYDNPLSEVVYLEKALWPRPSSQE